MKLSIFTFCGLLWGSVCAAAEPLEFSGYIKMSGEPQFVLTELSSKKPSGWLRKGQSFQGYRILDFDAKGEVLSVGHASGELRLPLKQSKIEDISASREAVLKEQEALLAAGKGNEESVFVSRIALLSRRRDAAPLPAEQIKFQEQLVAVHEQRETSWKSRRAVGVATQFDVLERTEDLLRAKVKLAELKRGGK